MTAGGDEVGVEVIGVFEQQREPLAEGPGLPVLLLRDGDGRELRLPTTQCEGLAINLAVQQHLVARPLAHDLGVRIIETLSASIARVVIDAYRDDTYYASIHLVSGTEALSIPARPGDAVALALRAEAPVFVSEPIIARADQTGDGA